MRPIEASRYPYSSTATGFITLMTLRMSILVGNNVQIHLRQHMNAEGVVVTMISQWLSSGRGKISLMSRRKDFQLMLTALSRYSCQADFDSALAVPRIAG